MRLARLHGEIITPVNNPNHFSSDKIAEQFLQIDEQWCATVNGRFDIRVGDPDGKDELQSGGFVVVIRDNKSERIGTFYADKVLINDLEISAIQVLQRMERR